MKALPKWNVGNKKDHQAKICTNLKVWQKGLPLSDECMVLTKCLHDLSFAP